MESLDFGLIVTSWVWD